MYFRRSHSWRARAVACVAQCSYCIVLLHSCRHGSPRVLRIFSKLEGTVLGSSDPTRKSRSLGFPCSQFKRRHLDFPSIDCNGRRDEWTTDMGDVIPASIELYRHHRLKDTTYSVCYPHGSQGLLEVVARPVYLGSFYKHPWDARYAHSIWFVLYDFRGFTRD